MTTLDIPNLDCMTSDELLMWADKMDDERLKVNHADQEHFSAYVALSKYARLAAGARADRLDGRIESAMTQERWCDRIYQQLPEWAKW